MALSRHTTILWDLVASIPAALCRILNRGRSSVVLVSAIPFSRNLRMFNLMFASSGLPAHGDSPLGFHDPGLSLATSPSTHRMALPITLDLRTMHLRQDTTQAEPLRLAYHSGGV